MNDKQIIERLQSTLGISDLSVSDVYPDDDGSLRREAGFHVDEESSLADMRRWCCSVANEYGGEFCDAMRIDDDVLTFVISYDEAVDQPPPWKIVREDPL